MLKTNWELNKTKFANLGINHYELPTDIFDWLKTKSFEAKEKDIDARESLAGHIRQEYFIKSNWAQEYKKDLGVDTDETFLRFGNWLSHRCFEKPLNMFTGTHYVLSRDRKMIISSLWANFQKKYEFNPPHTHGGVYSFIVFVNVPFNYEREKGQFNAGAPGSDFHTSKLYFLNLSPLNQNQNGIAVTLLDVDKSFEGKIILFPSNLTHGVHPFYTSDDYRITMSGNLVFDV